MIQTEEFSSSVIDTTRYHPLLGILEIKFMSGAIGVYVGVPSQTMVDFVAAPSAGTFYNSVIKGSYPFVSQLTLEEVLQLFSPWMPNGKLVVPATGTAAPAEPEHDKRVQQLAALAQVARDQPELAPTLWQLFDTIAGLAKAGV